MSYKHLSISLVVTGLAMAAFVGYKVGSFHGSGETELNWRELVLRADSANSGQTVSMATGRIDTDYEGLYVLDHLTGNLFCVVISPRNGQEIARYQTNVTALLGPDRQGDLDYVMTTGFLDAEQGGRVGNLRPAQSLCYVVEGNTGKIFAFTLAFSRQAVQTNTPQSGDLTLVWQNTVRATNIKRN